MRTSVGRNGTTDAWRGGMGGMTGVQTVRKRGKRGVKRGVRCSGVVVCKLTSAAQRGLAGRAALQRKGRTMVGRAFQMDTQPRRLHLFCIGVVDNVPRV